MTIDYLPLLAAVAAAFIAGYFSFVSLINSKEQKTSEFRQNWIDSLRKEISDFTASVYHIKYYYQQGSNNSDREFIAGIKDIHIQYVSSSTSILLRINANESDRYLKLVNDEFLNTLNQILDLVNSSNYDAASLKCTDLVNRAKPLLKEEWGRVKAGERGYKISKYFSMALFACTIIATVILLTAPMKAKTNPRTEIEAASAFGKSTNSQNCSLSVSIGESREINQSDICKD